MSTEKAPLPEAVREQIVSDFCAKGEHGWCMNRNFKETHCQCPCHAEAQRKRDLVEIERLKKKYPEEFAEAAAQQERARLADIFDQTESDVWRAHEVRDFLLSQNMAHPPPTPEGKP